jgi:hypothetical protein
MAGKHSWRPLPASHPDVPVLLVSTSFAYSSYDVRITDLANVWAESLDRRAICRRGFEQDTTIDPSENSEQMGVFLDKLAGAFCPESGNHTHSNITVSPAKLAGPSELSGSAAIGSDDLLLSITCVLPEPLRPLKWPMHLKRCSPSAVTTELVIPLIQAHHARVLEVEALLSIMKDKDNVITRVVDKLEATGTGLEHVFNILRGKRKATREVAEPIVRGLVAFSEEDFRMEQGKFSDKHGAKGVAELVQEAFGDGGLKYTSELDIEDAPELDTWWSRLGGTGVELVERKKTTTPQPESGLVNADDEDDFQVQETPPRLRAARKVAPFKKDSATNDDVSTSSERSSPRLKQQKPVQKATSPDPAPVKTGKLGRIGKRKSPISPPKPGSPEPAELSMDDVGSETASEPEEDGVESSPPHPPPNAQSPALPKNRLGRIGRKARTPTPEPQEAPSPAKPTPRQLGAIGKQSAQPINESKVALLKDTARGGQAEKTEDEAPIEDEQSPEAAEDRADRKREELQRELAKKAAAGPARKKRKF